MLFATGRASAQTASADTQEDWKKEVAKAIVDVRSGKVSNYAVQEIGDAHAVEAIPYLEKAFTAERDSLSKSVIASVLITLGDRQDQYWIFLANSMDAILNNGAPSPVDFDAQGRHISGPSPAFIDWARSHGLSPDDAATEAVYIQPGIFLRSALSGDRRAIPYLRHGLASPNSQIQAFSALGLAELQDKDSIPLIIARCKELPPESAGGVAVALFYFDDKDARTAFDLFVPKDHAKVMRENERPADGPFQTGRHKKAQ
jgi:hypothetical protein